MIGSLPFSETLDTTEATTDADDAQAASGCTAPRGDAPVTEASVWYSLTLTSDEVVQVDTSAADYDADVVVVTGSPGTSYHVLVFDCTAGGTNGGTLGISVAPVPTIQATVNAVGQVNPRTGVASISGTFACTGGDFVVIEGELRQNVGRVATIRGPTFQFQEQACDGGVHAWSADVQPDSGKFAGGRATADVGAFACSTVTCGDDHVVQTVRLRR